MDGYMVASVKCEKNVKLSFGRTDILSEYTVSGKAVEKVDKIKD